MANSHAKLEQLGGASGG